ncbi:YybH family protein [Cellulomonas sp. McL0617]|uniref:YybH family protein n=1 Tax=Cellulomonas sp. McL0617 TaxID=3415675 RepID=UPI003CF8255E
MDDDLSDLVRDTAEAAEAYVRGDTTRYLELTHHAPGFTLLPPFGGPAKVYDDRAQGITGSFFADGDAALEHVETHRWGDTAVVAMVERQHGVVGGMPDQDWSLRVTHVYRRADGRWLLVHRHADPLVRPIDLPALSRLTGGAPTRAHG